MRARFPWQASVQGQRYSDLAPTLGPRPSFPYPIFGTRKLSNDEFVESDAEVVVAELSETSRDKQISYRYRTFTCRCRREFFVYLPDSSLSPSDVSRLKRVARRRGCYFVVAPMKRCNKCGAPVDLNKATPCELFFENESLVRIEMCELATYKGPNGQ